jgi:hypothetical protein
VEDFVFSAQFYCGGTLFGVLLLYIQVLNVSKKYLGREKEKENRGM